MAYPTFPQIVGSQELLDDGTVVDRAVSGRPRFRTYFTNVRREFIVRHDVYTTDKDTLLSYYDTNRLLQFDFDWEGDNPATTYNVMFAKAPKVTPQGGDGRFIVENRLVVV